MNTASAQDHGDVPAVLSCVDAAIGTYPSAQHTDFSTYFLGTGASAEASAPPPSAPCPGGGTPAMPPDADGDTLDDGVVFPTNGTASSVILVNRDSDLTVQASAAGVLNAWIDLNRDGDWTDPGEQIFTDQALNSGVNNVMILAAQIPEVVPHGATYIRFRFCDAVATCNTPGGISANGEVEDYRILLALPNPSTLEICAPTNLINSDFEEPLTTSTNGRIAVFVGGLISIFRENVVPGWAFSSFSPSSGANFDQRNSVELWQSNAGIAPGNPNAYSGNQFAEINAFVNGSFHQDTVVTRGSELRWSFAHRARGNGLGQTDRMAVNIGPPGATVKQADFTSRNSQTAGDDCIIGNLLPGVNITAEEQIVNGTFWCFYSGSFPIPAGPGTSIVNRFEFEAEATATGSASSGNFVDLVTFSLIQDLGDAPVSDYGQACHSEQSLFNPPQLGSLVDVEPVSQGGNVTATTDDINGLADEDGVSFSSPSGGPHAEIFADAMVINDSGGDAFVCAWLDRWTDGGGTAVLGGDFDPGDIATNPAQTCQTVADNNGVATVVTFHWTDLPNVSGHSFARFRLCTIQSECNTPLGGASNGEVEDYRVDFDFNPTAVTIGEVELGSVSVTEFLADLDVDRLDRTELLALLAAWDAQLAATLSGADRGAILAALGEYLDPDGDGQVAILTWETLEQRGTIGFYVERRQGGGDWIQVNGDLLPSMVAPIGGEYSLIDPQADTESQLQYRLIELEAKGTRRSYGPYDVTQ